MQEKHDCGAIQDDEWKRIVDKYQWIELTQNTEDDDIDRDKVITGLELCSNISQDGCLMLCPYKDEKDETYSGFCEQVLKRDALALLKEQEAVEPQNVRKSSSHAYSGLLLGYCPKCGIKINSSDNLSACGKCGQRVKWNDD